MIEIHPDRYARLMAGGIPLAKRYVDEFGHNALWYMLSREFLQPNQRRNNSAFSQTINAILQLQANEAFREADTFLDAYMHPWMQSVAKIAPQNGIDAAGMRTQMTLNLHSAFFHKMGRRVFELSPGLAERLRHTELRGLTTDDLGLPYPSLFIRVDPTPELTVWNEISGDHMVEGVYIALDRSGVTGDPMWQIMVIGARHSDADEFDDGLYFFPVPLPPGRKLDDVIRDHMEETKLLIDAGAANAYGAKWADFFRWVVNIVVYATSSDIRREVVWCNTEAARLRDRIAKLPKGGKKDGLKARLRAMNPHERIFLGRGMPKLEEEWVARKGSSPTVRTLVTGHYKMQPFGPGRAERKRIHVEPYWRGPEDAVIHNPVHRLVGPTPSVDNIVAVEKSDEAKPVS